MANYKRLIDANALIEWIDMGHLRNPLETCFSERDVVDMLESRQTVDAVEVVRCKECKYARKEIALNNREYFMCKYTEMFHNENHFCSYGERRMIHEVSKLRC